MVAQLVPPPHPILACSDTLQAALTAASGVQPMYMTPTDRQEAVVQLEAAASMLAELQLRVLADATGVAQEAGFHDTGAWAGHHTRTDVPSARADAKLAEALDRAWNRVAAGMADGTVSLEQARVIAHGLDALPDHIGTEVIAKAEEQLVDYAKEFAPRELRKLALRILDVVAPEIAEAEQAKRLEDEEQRAREKCRLSLRATGEGTTRITGLIPDADAARLRTYLEAFTSPRKGEDALSGEGDRVPYPRRLGHAFCALLEHLDPTKLPQHGGDAATLMITIGLDSLRTALGVGTIVGGGESLSATAIRRLACNASIIPVVLGGKGEILDLGRSRRLFSPAQRKAMRLRDQHRRAEGCTVPAHRCEAHHLKAWSEGGRTDVDDGVHYCTWHHHRAHDPQLTTEKLPNGDYRFHRRT